VLVYEQWKSVGTKNWNDQKAVLTGYTAQVIDISLAFTYEMHLMFHQLIGMIRKKC